jgi:hypothetical protein
MRIVDAFVGSNDASSTTHAAQPSSLHACAKRVSALDHDGLSCLTITVCFADGDRRE